jgi:hypothetical protein
MTIQHNTFQVIVVKIYLTTMFRPFTNDDDLVKGWNIVAKYILSTIIWKVMC